MKKYEKILKKVLTLRNRRDKIKPKKKEKGGRRIMSMTLKAIRINKNLSQEAAAKLLGIGSDTLSNYERGKTFPDVPVIKKMEEVYEVKYDDINFLI